MTALLPDTGFKVAARPSSSISNGIDRFASF